jgi:7,8-dihydropterin-6-yl-methyl-4-(beta-D-ribofuranosyl)aminobenzene 5'-phosphate synthase
MSDKVRITLVVENSVHRQGLAAEHGLSFHVQIGPYSILFDTGQTELVLSNAEALGIKLGTLDTVVLSHGHYDHTGGVPAILDAAPKARAYAHPAAFENKYSKGPDGEPRFIGMSQRTAQAIRGVSHKLVQTPGWKEIVKGVYVTGEIPRETAYEDRADHSFWMLNACARILWPTIRPW